MVSSVYGAKIMKDRDLIPNNVTVLVTGTVQEEDCDGLCWQYIVNEDKIKPEFVVITEPTDNGISVSYTHLDVYKRQYLQRPLELGADVVVHSATKYLNGHGDVIAGFVVGSAEFINEVKMFGIKDMTGAVIDPFAAYLILRGLKTFELRMMRHCENARAIAEMLSKHEKVEKVYFPGLETSAGHDIAVKQMRDFGGMVSFEVKGGKTAGMKFVNALKLCTIAVSLGDAETLVAVSYTHLDVYKRQV